MRKPCCDQDTGNEESDRAGNAVLDYAPELTDSPRVFVSWEDGSAENAAMKSVIATQHVIEDLLERNRALKRGFHIWLSREAAKLSILRDRSRKVWVFAVPAPCARLQVLTLSSR